MRSNKVDQIMQKKSNIALAEIVSSQCDFIEGKGWEMPPVPASYEVSSYQIAYLTLLQRGYSDKDIYDKELRDGRLSKNDK